MAFRLAELVVDLSVRGFGDVMRQVNAVGRGMERTRRQVGGGVAPGGRPGRVIGADDPDRAGLKAEVERRKEKLRLQQQGGVLGEQERRRSLFLADVERRRAREVAGLGAATRRRVQDMADRLTGRAAGGGQAAGGEADGSDVLRRLNQQRREGVRLQRLARYLGDGEAATAGMLEKAYLRLVGRSQDVRKAFEAKNRTLADSIIKERGYTGAQAFLFRGLVQTHLALGRFGAGLGRVSEALSPLSRAAGTAFAALTAGIGGLVAAGLRGTTAGAALSARFTYLSRSIAAIFLPVIDRVVGALDRLITWFQHLGRRGQDTILNFTLAAVAGAGLAKVLTGPLLGGVQAVIIGLQQLTAWGITFDLVTGGALLAVGALVVGVGALTVGTEAGRGVLQDMADTFGAIWDAISPVVGAFMDFASQVTVSKGLIGGLITFISPLAGAFYLLSGPIKYIAEKVRPMVQQLAGAFSGLFDSLSGALAELMPELDAVFGRDTWDTIADVIGTAVRGMQTAVEALTAAVKAARIAIAFARTGDMAESVKTVELDDKVAEQQRRERGRERQGGGGRGLQVVGHGFEGAADTWKRIASAGLNQDYDRQTAASTKKIAENTDPNRKRRPEQDQPAVVGP